MDAHLSPFLVLALAGAGALLAIFVLLLAFASPPVPTRRSRDDTA